MLYNFLTKVFITLSDTYTSVGLYFKINDKFSDSFLLEISDYKSKENSDSNICLYPIASFIDDVNQTRIIFPQKNFCKTNFRY